MRALAYGRGGLLGDDPAALELRRTGADPRRCTARGAGSRSWSRRNDRAQGIRIAVIHRERDVDRFEPQLLAGSILVEDPATPSRVYTSMRRSC
jgi:hypothetical protein